MRFRPGARSRLCLGIVVTLGSTVGCAPAPDRASHTVEDYQEDPRLKHKELARCTSYAGSRGESPDCENARAAERSKSVGNLRNLPPLRLPNAK